MDFFLTAEGYVKAVNAHGTISYNYIFNHKDHLGNVRLSYTNNGSVQIVQQDNYYSFGLKHEKYNVDEYVHVEVEGEDGYDIGLVLLEPGERNPYQYKFGGKEFQDELGLNMYDFGARNYDPALGRWMNIDPLAETSRRFSPYTYALNNPVYFIDPDGMEAEGFDSGDANTTRSTGETETASGTTESKQSDVKIRIIHEYTVNRGYGLEVSNRNNVASVNSEHFDIQDPPKKKKKNGTNDWLGNGGSVKYNGKAYFGTNYIGPGLDVDPYSLKDNDNLLPLDMLDQAAFEHDVAYYKANTGGAKGAFKELAVNYADIKLASDALRIIREYRKGGIDPITGEKISARTRNAAKLVYMLFKPIESQKSTRQNVNIEMNRFFNYINSSIRKYH